MRSGARERAQVPALTSVHVVIHAHASSFSRFSHSGVVQMSLACAEQLQGSAGEERGVAGHRGRRVQEVRVQVDDVVRQLGGQHERLSEAANPARVGSRAKSRHQAAIASPISRKRRARRQLAQTRAAARVQIFGQVDDRRADLGMDRDGLRRRSDGAAKTARARRPRCSSARSSCAMKVSDSRGIALEDHRDDAGRERTIHPIPVPDWRGAPDAVSHAVSRGWRVHERVKDAGRESTRRLAPEASDVTIAGPPRALLPSSGNRLSPAAGRCQPGREATRRMERSFFRYILHHTWRNQVLLLIVTAVSFPLIYINLAIPKRIVNNAIGGKHLPAADARASSSTQVRYLMALSFAAARAHHAERRDQVLAQRLQRRRRRAHGAPPAARALPAGAALSAAAVQDDVLRRDDPDDHRRDRPDRRLHRRVDRVARVPGRPA